MEQAVKQIEQLEGKGREHLCVHFANSPALLDAGHHESLRQNPGGYSRPGVACYGYYCAVANFKRELKLGDPVNEKRLDVFEGTHTSVAANLTECMSMIARITHINTVEAGTTVGYSRNWTATETCRIATLGIGYADGYPRVGSNKTFVGIRGKFYPQVGNICMDMIMVNLGPVEGPGKDI